VFEETENFTLGDEETDDEVSMTGGGRGGQNGYALMDGEESLMEKEPLAGGRIR